MPLRSHSVFCVLLGLSGMVAIADDQPENLIAEPSFEGDLGDNGLPAEWYGLHTMPAGAYEYAIVDEAHSGQHSLRIEGRGQFGVAWGEKLPVERGRQYMARGWVRVEGDVNAAADVKLHYYGSGQQYLGQSRIGWVNPRTSGWQFITVTGQTELYPEAEYVSIAVALAGNGEAWFDDIELFIAGDEPETVNYVANGDMEDVAADRPGGWYLFVSEGDQGECSIETENPHGGLQCLHLVGDAESCSAGSVQIPIEPDQQYELTGFVRSTTGSGRLAIAYFKDGEYIGVTRGAGSAEESWQAQTVTTEFEAFPDATHIAAVVMGTGEFEAWFDDLRINAVE